MATIAEGGLFPPIVDTYLPAINIDDVLFKVYEDHGDNHYLRLAFNLSPYNNLQDLQSFHVSITRQSNYHSIFDAEDYPLGIYVRNFFEDDPDARPTELDQTCLINIENLNFNEINYNEYYKVQFRLSKDRWNQSFGESLSRYLTNESNLAKFSEWSTVCLIRFIAPPKIYIKGDTIEGTDKTLQDSGSNIINSSKLTISGKYLKRRSTGIIDGQEVELDYPSNLYNVQKDNEYLSSYRVLLTGANREDVYYDSGEMNVDIQNPNQFEYTIPYYFNNNQARKIWFHYTTANLYEKTLTYQINPQYTKNSWGEQTNLVETVSTDNVIGKTNIYFEAGTATQSGTIGTLTVRRGSDKDNFSIFETLWTKTVTVADLPLSFDDFTIESGVLYKYEINLIKPNRSIYTITEGPVISVFDHAFLTGEGTQLCVRFNPNVSSFNKKVSDNIITTIGSKYPYVTRNGNIGYRTFSLSGTIAYEMDSEHQFSSRGAIYGDWINVYGSYFVNHYFNQRNDRVTQRKFRELVMDYLYSDIPKLFRSTPEGNILVRLTDVSLTPNQQLGRMIYDFTCTATEIGECSIDNYKLYEIQDFGD